MLVLGEFYRTQGNWRNWVLELFAFAEHQKIDAASLHTGLNAGPGWPSWGMLPYPWLESIKTVHVSVTSYDSSFTFTSRLESPGWSWWIFTKFSDSWILVRTNRKLEWSFFECLKKRVVLWNQTALTASFWFLHPFFLCFRSFPMFIHGTPWNNVRTEGIWPKKKWAGHVVLISGHVSLFWPWRLWGMWEMPFHSILFQSWLPLTSSWKK